MEVFVLKREIRKKFAPAAAMLAAFVLWTLAVRNLDVSPIGPEGSSVGFAAINGYFHRLTGAHMGLYILTDQLSLIPLGCILGFALLGLTQWVRRRALRKVDFSIFVLGGFYVLVLGAFVLFEIFPVNYRPVLIEGVLEASYPSSTTLLVMCVMPTAAMQLRGRIPNPALRKSVCVAITVFSLFMVAGRLVSGVHWLTDIIGGGLLSAGLALLYRAVCSLEYTR